MGAKYTRHARADAAGEKRAQRAAGHAHTSNVTQASWTKKTERAECEREKDAKKTWMNSGKLAGQGRDDAQHGTMMSSIIMGNDCLQHGLVAETLLFSAAGHGRG